MVDTLSDEKYEELKAAHAGETVRVETICGTAVFKCPDSVQYRTHTKMIANAEQGATMAMDWLCLAVLVHPARDVFKEWIAKKPGLSATCTKHIHRLAGVDADAEAKS
jgi:hypothetical protein